MQTAKVMRMARSTLRPVTWDRARLGAYTTMARYRLVSRMKLRLANILTLRSNLRSR